MADQKKLKLKSLWINTENYRFEPTESQAEAIAVMVEDQNEKLYNIAESISQNGMNPIDLAIVTDLPNHAGKFLVLEGNRRITALKLWTNPSLLKDTSASSGLKKKFDSLNTKAADKIPDTIDCVFFNDPTEADKWIKLKHTGENSGVGTVSWDGQQAARYQVRVGEKSSPGLQVLEYLKAVGAFDPALRAKLPEVRVTTLTRLVTDKDIQKVLGISIESGQVTSTLPEVEVLKGYTQVVKDLLTKGFSVKKVYTKEQREQYANNFPAASRPNLTTSTGTPWTSNPSKPSVPTPPASPATKVKKSSTERTKVIPKNCNISISNPKVNGVYDELQRLHLSEFIYAASALFRVFIELSFDIYIEEYTLTTAPSSAKSGTALQTKGFQVVNHMKTKGWSDDGISLGIRNLLSGKDSILSLETLHGYLHNHRVSPTDDTLKKVWDSIQDFIIILWNNIK